MKAENELKPQSAKQEDVDNGRCSPDFPQLQTLSSWPSRIQVI